MSKFLAVHVIKCDTVLPTVVPRASYVSCFNIRGFRALWLPGRFFL